MTIFLILLGSQVCGTKVAPVTGFLLGRLWTASGVGEEGKRRYTTCGRVGGRKEREEGRGGRKEEGKEVRRKKDEREREEVGKGKSGEGRCGKEEGKGRKEELERRE